MNKSTKSMTMTITKSTENKCAKQINGHIIAADKPNVTTCLRVSLYRIFNMFYSCPLNDLDLDINRFQA